MDSDEIINELRAENQTLRQRAEQFETLVRLLEDSLDGIWDWNVLTGDDYLSPRWKGMLGYTDEELPNRVESWIELLLPEDVSKGYAAVNAHFEQGAPYDLVLRYLRKDGSMAHMLVRGKAVQDENGQWVRMAGTHTDVTALKETERELRASQERYRQLVWELEALTADLKRSNEDLEQFAYVASHDLRSPLRAISQLAGWIQEDLGDDLNPDVAQHIRLMRDRITGLERLHNDLLEYARAGRSPMQTEVVDLEALVREIWDVLTKPAGFRLETTGLSTVRTERVALKQCLHNLIDNALKHHHGESGEIRVSAQVEDNTLVMQVQDDGPGIAEHYREQIFAMFQTLKSRDQGGGSGVGLALVRKLVHRARGSVTVLPSEGRGATFQFTWTLGGTPA